MKKIRENLFTFKLHSAELLSFSRDLSHKKIHESLFTFKLYNAELHSFWRDFSQKIQTSNFTLYDTKTISSVNFVVILKLKLLL